MSMARSYLRPESRSEDASVQLFNEVTQAAERDVVVNHIHSLFRAQVLGPAFPCALGKNAFANLRYRVGVYEAMSDQDSADGLTKDLQAFVSEQPSIGTGDDFSTFVALFKSGIPVSEIDFEDNLWLLLRRIHGEDKRMFEWDPSTNKDPSSEEFSFSVGGQSFFVVGIHVHSSRISRKFVYPAIAFNAHHQFEHLRSTNKFERMQTIIRRNDTRIQGGINPALQDYGNDSEAKQYSGRLVPPDWKCPFP